MPSIQVALVGQPNVGKSSLFFKLTGVGVISSNYSGTTVEFDEGVVKVGDTILHIYDLPGIYSLSVNLEDEKIVVDMLRSNKNNMILFVMDSNNIESSLAFFMEVSELGFPIIVALNKIDLSSKRFDINVEKLSKILGVPIIPVSTRSKQGIDDLITVISNGEAKISDYKTNYDDSIAKYSEEIMKIDQSITWGHSIKLLEGLNAFTEKISQNTYERSAEIVKNFTKMHREAPNISIAKSRFEDARDIYMTVVKPNNSSISKKNKISEIIITPPTGVPIFLFVAALIFFTVIFVGGWLSELIDNLYTTTISQWFCSIGYDIGGEFGRSIMNGVNTSIVAILSLVIPYIALFYILLGILEDSGYMPRMVVLLDRVIRKFGVQGNAFLPMMVGFGCNVPAILSTRIMHSKKEKLVTCTLICMAVPCSAQLATITGVTGKYAGVFWIAIILTILLIIGITIGIVLNKKLNCKISSLAIELPELQMPRIHDVFIKTWIRIKDFFEIAVPLLVVGSIITELMVHYNILFYVVDPMSWLTVGLLGLPASTIICFITGILRKEMSYGMLVILAAAQNKLITEFMSPQQFVVFGIVMATYMPCLATMIAMHKEIGIKYTISITLISVCVAIIVGSVFNVITHTII